MSQVQEQNVADEQFVKVDTSDLDFDEDNFDLEESGGPSITSTSGQEIDEQDLDTKQNEEQNSEVTAPNVQSNIGQNEDEEEEEDSTVQKTSQIPSPISTPPPAPEKKVELDLEEAPFLEEEKEEVKEEEEKQEQNEGESDEKKGKFNLKLTKKKIIILAGGLLLIIILAVVAVLFLGGGEEEVSEEAQASEEPAELEPFVVIVEEFKEPEGPPIYTEELDPFWIEMKDAQGETFFLVCNFALTTEDPVFLNEIQANIPEIRDTVYYFLTTRNYEFLTNHQNFPYIKENLLVLINRLLQQDQLTEVLYNNYITK